MLACILMNFECLRENLQEKCELPGMSGQSGDLPGELLYRELLPPRESFWSSSSVCSHCSGREINSWRGSPRRPPHLAGIVNLKNGDCLLSLCRVAGKWWGSFTNFRLVYTRRAAKLSPISRSHFRTLTAALSVQNWVLNLQMLVLLAVWRFSGCSAVTSWAHLMIYSENREHPRDDLLRSRQLLSTKAHWLMNGNGDICESLFQTMSFNNLKKNRTTVNTWRHILKVETVVLLTITVYTM